MVLFFGIHSTIFLLKYDNSLVSKQGKDQVKALNIYYVINVMVHRVFYLNSCRIYYAR